MAILKSFEVIQRFKQFLWTRRAYLKFSENVRHYHGVDTHVYFRNYRDLFNQYYNGRRATFEEFWSDLVNLGFEYPRHPKVKSIGRVCPENGVNICMNFSALRNDALR